jgi:hypothetical protein
MRDDDHGRPLLVGDAAQQLHHRAPTILVEGRGGLVGEDERRPVGEGARDRHALLLAATQSVGVRRRAVLHAQVRKQLVRARPRVVPLADLAGDLDVSTSGQKGNQVRLLEHEPDVRAA